MWTTFMSAVERQEQASSMLRLSMVGMLAAAAAMLFATSSAQAQRRVDAGVLLCNMGPSIGALVASRQRIECRYTSRTGNRVEHYSGAITRFGFDLGAVVGGVMSWGVRARTRSLGRGALAGNYVGISGEASLGLGAGVNVLVGGSRRSVMLQPVSVVGQVGINLAIGVAGLTLRLENSSTR
jgi:hypothetical protein